MEELTKLIRNLQTKFDEQTIEKRHIRIPQTINNNMDEKFAYMELKYTSKIRIFTDRPRGRSEPAHTTTRK